jgi:hypothetical protein
VWRFEGNKPMGRFRHRWEDNIAMDLQKWDVGMELIYVTQHRDTWCALMIAVIKLRIP